MVASRLSCLTRTALLLLPLLPLLLTGLAMAAADTPVLLSRDGRWPRSVLQNRERYELLFGRVSQVVDGLLPDGVLAAGLAPLVDRFREHHAHGAMRRLEDLRTVMAEAGYSSVLPVETLVAWNILYELTQVFPPDFARELFSNEEFQPLLVPARYEGEGDAQPHRMVAVGYVGGVQGGLVEDMISVSLELQDGSSYMLSQTLKALELAKEEEDEDFAIRSNSSRCTQTSSKVECSKHFDTISTGILRRGVLWELPLGDAPENGWPVVLMFQGTFFSPRFFSWSAHKLFPFGAYYQTEVIKTLLDNGYAVITPETHLLGFTFWDTNIPPFSLIWEIALDHYFMLKIFEEVDNPSGMFGHLDPGHMFATGISSGGYMTSRVGVEYPDRFRALAIQSGAYAWCAGPLCLIPRLPANHPPTLFLHGGSDLIVPIFTMEMYETELARDGVPTKKFIQDDAGHEWFEGAGSEVLRWFDTYFNGTNI